MRSSLSRTAAVAATIAAMAGTAAADTRAWGPPLPAGTATPEAVPARARRAPAVTHGGRTRLYAHRWDVPAEIVELDPRTGLELYRIPAPEPNVGLEAGLAFDGRSLWFVSGAAGGGSGLLFELDPADGSVRNIHPPPVPPPSIDGLAALGGLAGDDTTFELSWTIFRDGFESGDTSAWSATVP